MNLGRDNPIQLERIANPSMVSHAEELQGVLKDVTLWNQHRLRTDLLGPHRYVSDIWVRCLDWAVMQKDPALFNEAHESSWYPMATQRLSLAKWLAEWICAQVGGEKIGGVLITKIPAGTCVLPHIDRGWHARHYQKFAFSIAAHPMQEFCFEKKRLVTVSGDWFSFDNSYTHWVTNPSPLDRITMIVCIKRPTPPDPNGPT